jgi:hypothetical protein
MALTLRTDGSGSPNLVGAAWWNDYYDLLTGSMNDQPVFLYYKPGSSTSTPALELQTNGNAPLLVGLGSGGATKLSVDSSGNLTASGALSFDATKVASDGSGNVEMGVLALTTLASDGSAYGGAHLFNSSANNALTLKSLQSGATAQGIEFRSWDGTASHVPFSVGGQFGSALSYVDNSGNMSAVAINASSNIVGKGWIQNNPPGNGSNWLWMYRSTVTSGATVNKDWVQVYDGSTGNIYFYDNTDSLTAWAALPTGVLEIGTSRNGSPALVPIYTGTSTPSGQPVGAIWIKA